MGAVSTGILLLAKHLQWLSVLGKSQEGKITLGTVKSGLGGAVKAMAHHPIPSPVPPTCVMASCFLEASCL